MPRQLLDDLRFKDLGRETMMALEQAGHEIHAIATCSVLTGEMIDTKYCIGTDALCFLTGRSTSAVNYWVSTGKIKPAKKFGNFSLFALADVNHLLSTGRFPGAKVERIYEPATTSWINPPAEVIAEAEEEIAEAVEAEKQPGKAKGKPKKRTA